MNTYSIHMYVCMSTYIYICIGGEWFESACTHLRTVTTTQRNYYHKSKGKIHTHSKLYKLNVTERINSFKGKQQTS